MTTADALNNWMAATSRTDREALVFDGYTRTEECPSCLGTGKTTRLLDEDDTCLTVKVTCGHCGGHGHIVIPDALKIGDEDQWTRDMNSMSEADFTAKYGTK